MLRKSPSKPRTSSGSRPAGRTSSRTALPYARCTTRSSISARSPSARPTTSWCSASIWSVMPKNCSRTTGQVSSFRKALRTCQERSSSTGTRIRFSRNLGEMPIEETGLRPKFTRTVTDPVAPHRRQRAILRFQQDTVSRITPMVDPEASFRLSARNLRLTAFGRPEYSRRYSRIAYPFPHFIGLIHRYRSLPGVQMVSMLTGAGARNQNYYWDEMEPKVDATGLPCP